MIIDCQLENCLKPQLVEQMYKALAPTITQALKHSGYACAHPATITQSLFP
jgi:hypothetical protein